MQALRFFLNGKPVALYNVDPRWTLADYLRSDEVRLMGTKHGDDDGLFGSDTLTVSFYDAERDVVHHQSILAALVPLVSLANRAVTTIEGIGNLSAMHPLQEHFAACDATQCGSCQSGFTMSMYSLLRTKNTVDCADIEEALDGNICRCTGYRPIAAAVASFSTDCPEIFKERWNVSPAEWDPSTEADLPATLKRATPSIELHHEVLSAETGEPVFTNRYVAPSTLSELVSVRKANPAAKLIGGNTHRVIDGHGAGSFVGTSAVAEMRVFSVDEKTVTIGANRTVADLRDALSATDNKMCTRVSDFLRFALSTQRRNMATLGGELACDSSEPDLAVALAVLGASIRLVDLEGVETTEPVETVAGKVAAGMTVVSVTIPVPAEKTSVYLNRQARRRVNAQPLLTVGFSIDDDDVKVFIGGVTGMASGYGRIVRHTALEAEFLNMSPADALAATLPVDAVADRHSTYRRRVFGGVVFKAMHAFAEDNGIPAPEDLELYPPRSLGIPTTRRSWPEELTQKVVGHPTKPLSAKAKAVGDPLFTIDRSAAGSLHAALVMAPKPGYKILGFDTEEAFALEGVVDFVCAKDIPGVNIHSGIPPVDTKVFQDATTLHYNEPIGAIIAKDVKTARAAAKLVRPRLEKDEAFIHCPDIASAMEHKQYHPNCGEGDMVLQMGDPDKAFTECDVVFEGETFMGGQDHTYGENLIAIVEPEGDSNFTVHCATQNPTKIQFDVAAVLGIKNSQVIAKTTRLGGGFGGKQDRPGVFATVAAVASHKVNAPVRLELDRTTDMLVSGGRHPYYYKYKVGAMKTGKIVATDVLLVSDGGATFDVTAAVLNKSIFQSNGPYTIPHMRVEGRAAKTARVTNTAYRGFGGPQGAFIAEEVVDRVALELEMDPIEIRRMNLNQEGDLNIAACWDQKDWRQAEGISQRLWDRINEETDFKERRAAVEKFNETHKNVKRGVAVVNIRNSCLFEEAWMNQAMANVHVFRDGTVAVSHSGVEMGQGLDEKVRQAVCEMLPVTREDVRIYDCSTETCSNTNPTSASSGPDLNLPPVVECCEKILARLKPFLEDDMSNWVGAINGAFFKGGVDLHESAYFSCDETCQFHWTYGDPFKATWSGPSGLYSAYALAIADIELDILTGEWKALRLDLIEDVGRALNPHVDLGQVEGGTIQGMGLFTSEAVEWDLDGRQITDNLHTYAVPTISDVPLELNSYILENTPNVTSKAFQSKVAEEAPTLLGCVFLYALKDAVRAARTDKGKKGWFPMPSPATKEQIMESLMG